MMWTVGLLFLIVKLSIVLAVLLGLAASMVLIERKLLGRFQVRYGPNRVGIFGTLQPVADGIKMLLKEDTIPQGADRIVFLYAPAVVTIVALLSFAVVPFGRDVSIFGRKVPMVISDLNVGVLFFLGLSSLNVYGIVLSAWASNSKYSLLGGIRGAAQMISYELALGLSIVPIVMLAGSFSLVDIVNAQASYPFILVQPVAFVIFIVSATAELKRIPFDFPEGENEIIGGYHTEYSGMRFGLFFLGEYIGMIVMGALLAIFFLGGWRGPLLPPIVWFFIKIMIVPFFLIWTRATHPRLRFDQFMHFGWKILLPAALLNIVVTAAIILGVGE